MFGEFQDAILSYKGYPSSEDVRSECVRRSVGRAPRWRRTRDSAAVSATEEEGLEGRGSCTLRGAWLKHRERCVSARFTFAAEIPAPTAPRPLSLHSLHRGRDVKESAKGQAE